MNKIKIVELVLLIVSTLISTAKAIVKFADYIGKTKLKKTPQKCN